ncbi:MAG TPA: MerR family transcriptional regulator [Kofleriaceae bacterium]|nr:MerR family transcriptional regulator [Kofleriaceae bacterium]
MSAAAWTLSELTRRVAEALASDEAPANGQVRAVPDERSVRYYTTLGLIDRPRLRGRTALYGLRHLAQVVAVKRMQAAGRSLAEIQRVLPTLDDADLARASGVTLIGPRRAATRADFWRTTPVAAAPAEAEAAPDPDPAPDPVSPAAAPAAPGFVPQLHLTLAPGVTLTLAGHRAPTAADADAVRAAAAPLLAELARRHLIAVTAVTLEEEPHAADPDHD